jgi:hypothetical protein
VPLGPADGRDRRVGLGQVDASRATCCSQPAGDRRRAQRAGRRAKRRPRRWSRRRRLRGDRGHRADRPRARGRPDADRQDAALVPGDLRRLLGRDPAAVRRHHRGARARLRRRRFSFNTGAGRCPACEGQGVQTIEMSFLPDVKVSATSARPALQPRDAAGDAARQVDRRGARDERRRGAEFFEAHRSIAHPLKLLQDVGLGYLTLGQPSPTLSGGEAQRIKLVTELAKVRDLGARRRRASGRCTRCTCSTSRRWACTWPTSTEADPRAAPAGRRGQHAGGDRARRRSVGRGRLDPRPRPEGGDGGGRFDNGRVRAAERQCAERQAGCCSKFLQRHRMSAAMGRFPI